MAVGDSDVGICNKALLLLGAETITSFSDGSAAGAACSTLYNDVKLTTLGMYAWSFTIKKAQLSKETATPESEWREKLTNEALCYSEIGQIIQNTNETKEFTKRSC